MRRHSSSSSSSSSSSTTTTTTSNRAVRPQRATTGTEEELRTQLATDNEQLTPGDEERAYTQLDGALPPAAVLEKLGKERSFAQVVLDKAVEVVDDIIFSSSSSSSSSDKSGGAPRSSNSATKERVVVLGSGWGAQAFLSSVDAEKYDVTVVSPRNYFLFTPMLAGAAVGTVEYRSITQPIRNANAHAKYLEATCTNVEPGESFVECSVVACEGTSCEIEEFQLPYDHLVVSVGAQVNTFGIPGVKEHCIFLKQVEDAAKLRRAIGNCFERASVPGISDAQRRAALTFAVIGAGPTGVEFCAELCDFIEQDVPRFYPALLPFVSVKLVEASDKVLVAFDEALQAKALETLQTRLVPSASSESASASASEDGSSSSSSRPPLVEVLLKAGVKEVRSDALVFANNSTLKYGLSVWAAGIGPLPLVLDLTKKVPGQQEFQQTARGKLFTDQWLRVRGSPNIYAIGDCSFVEGAAYPATAQVAAQQGSYLSRLFSRNYDLKAPIPKIAGEKQGVGQNLIFDESGQYAKRFQFLNLGILAYLGDSQALAQIQVDKSTIKGSGAAGFALWRSVYLSKQVSLRNRVLVDLLQVARPFVVRQHAVAVLNSRCLRRLVDMFIRARILAERRAASTRWAATSSSITRTCSHATSGSIGGKPSSCTSVTMPR